MSARRWSDEYDPDVEPPDETEPEDNIPDAVRDIAPEELSEPLVDLRP